MKKIIIIILGILMLPAVAFATPVSWDKTGSILQPLQSSWSDQVKIPYITATSTTATSTFPKLNITNFLQLTGTSGNYGSYNGTTFTVSRSDFGTVANFLTPSAGYVGFTNGTIGSVSGAFVYNANSGNPAIINSGSNTNQIYAATNGNVGIGTATAGEKLSLNGNLTVNAGNSLCIANTSYTCDANWRLGRNVSTIASGLVTSNAFQLVTSGVANEGLVIGVNGGNSALEINGSGNAYFRNNLSIGTTTGANPFTVLSTTYPQTRIAYNTGTYATLGVTSNGYAVLGNANLGIGETLPASKLAVSGGVAIGNSTTYSQATAPTGGLIVQGNVGIGSTTPTYPLSVNGNIGVSLNSSLIGPIVNGDQAYVKFDDAGTGSRLNFHSQFTDFNSSVATRFNGASLEINNGFYTQNGKDYTNFANGASSGSQLQNSGANILNARYWNTSTTNSRDAQSVERYILSSNSSNQPKGRWALSFNDTESYSNIEALSVLNTGNVGIGTTSPLAKLSIQTTGTTNAILVGSSTNANTSFVVNSNGYVGIGNSAPTNQFTIGNGTQTGVYATFMPSTGTQGLFAFNDGAIQKWSFGKDTDNSFIIYNNNTNKYDLKVNNSNDNILLNYSGVGYTGIGTTSPSAPLSVNGLSLFHGALTQDVVATSTFAGGINITSGCFSVNGTCITGGGGGGSGTVTSVAASGGTTGLSFTGSPITTSGTLTLGGTLNVANGGTGSTTLTGILKGAGTSAIVSAVAGTDYQAPITLTTTGSGNATFSANTLNIPNNGTVNSGSAGTFAYYPSSSAAVSSTLNLYMDGSSNIGVGVASSLSSKLVVNGSQTIGASYTSTAAPSNGLLVQGNVGIGTTTPGSLLSLGGIANFTTATSTFYSTGGINLTGGGCFAINGTCIGAGGGGSGTVNSGTTGYFPFYAASGTSLTATSTLFLSSTGNIGVASTSPLYLLSIGNKASIDVNGNATTTSLTVNSTANGTTTVQIGDVGKPACLKVRNTNDAGWTYLTVNNGTLTASTASCQ